MKNSQNADFQHIGNLSSDPGEARTLDPLIKSQLLYQLSYGVSVLFRFLHCKVTANFRTVQIFL